VDIQEQPLENTTRPIILIADDEAVTQKVFSLTLEKLGYKYVIAKPMTAKKPWKKPKPKSPL